MLARAARQHRQRQVHRAASCGLCRPVGVPRRFRRTRRHEPRRLDAAPCTFGHRAVLYSSRRSSAARRSPAEVREMAEAIIFIGLPGSGKTTYFTAHFAATHAHVSRDVQQTAERETALIRECLRAGRSFVIDDTNGTRAVRAQYIRD